MTLARQNAELSQGIDVSSGVLNQTLFVPFDNFVNISGTVTANTGIFDLVEFNNATEIVPTEGQLTWDTTYGTLDIGFTNTYALHVGQETNFRVRNETGGILYKGQCVYATGVHSDNIRLEIGKYAADGTVREVRFIGLISEDIGDNGSGYTTNFGYIRGNATYPLDTRGNVESPIAVGDETWAQGDILYVHPTVAGKLTKVEPKHSISVALVVRVHQTDGVILVRPTSYGHLEDNHDVTYSGLVDNNLLVWNSGADTWEPSSGLYYVNDKLGIGTNSPARNIDVVSSAGTSVGIKLNSTGTGGRSYSFFSTNNGSSLGGGKFGMYDDTAQASRLVIDSSGNVGIGSNNPTYKLEVDGSFSATTKSFKIKHPSKEDGILEYGSLESPYHGIRLTGKDKLKKGSCIVKLPDYIKDLVQEDGINFQITNYKHHKILYVDKIDLNKNEITIKGYRCKTSGELEFYWTFSAIRKDVPELVVEK